MRHMNAILAAAVLVLHAGTAVAADADARADLRDPDGRLVGEVLLHAVPHGTLLHARFVDLPPGTHAFHIHAVGECEPPFTSAGGHYNPDGKAHGIAASAGMHAGDMPNIHVPASRSLEIEVHNPRVSVRELLDNDGGTAIVLHRDGDDYRTDPAGDAGPRIACGVITAD